MKRPTEEEVEREILALDTLDTKALKARWRVLYRKDAPPKFRARRSVLGLLSLSDEQQIGVGRRTLVATRLTTEWRNE